MIRLLSARGAAMIVVLTCAAASEAQQPDGAIPVPAPRPTLAVPVPDGKPAAEADREMPPKSVSSVPVPKRRPQPPGDGDGTPQTAGAEVLPAEEAACRDRLSAMGVRFTPARPIDGTNGCGIAHPIRVLGLPRQVTLSGRAVMGCPVTEALANWTLDVAIPQAEKQFGASLVRIEHYASYVCRSRNSQSGARLSEHARGNAVDVGRFHLSGGIVVDVASDAEDDAPETRFLKALRDGACAHFKTVLGPGSDPYHDTHFHFDMARRRNGSRYCR